MSREPAAANVKPSIRASEWDFRWSREPFRLQVVLRELQEFMPVERFDGTATGTVVAGDLGSRDGFPNRRRCFNGDPIRCQHRIFVDYLVTPWIPMEVRQQ